MASLKNDLPFDQVWIGGAEFKLANPGCVLSIRTAAKAFSTGRTKFVVGVHHKRADSAPVAEHVAMKLEDAAGTRLVILREAMAARAAYVPTDMAMFADLD
jgi:uncharacterized protein (DUF1778 family)